MVSKSPKKLEMDKVKELFMSRLEVKEQEEGAKVEEEKKKEQDEKKKEVKEKTEVEKKASPPRAPPAPPQTPPQAQAKEEPTTSDGMLRDEIMGTVLLFLRDTLSIFIIHFCFRYGQDGSLGSSTEASAHARLGEAEDEEAERAPNSNGKKLCSKQMFPKIIVNSSNIGARPIFRFQDEDFGVRREALQGGACPLVHRPSAL